MCANSKFKNRRKLLTILLINPMCTMSIRSFHFIRKMWTSRNYYKQLRDIFNKRYLFKLLERLCSGKWRIKLCIGWKRIILSILYKNGVFRVRWRLYLELWIGSKQNFQILKSSLDQTSCLIHFRFHFWWAINLIWGSLSINLSYQLWKNIKCNSMWIMYW